MSDYDSESEIRGDAQPQLHKTFGASNFRRRFSQWLLIALAIVLLPYAFFRLTSDGRKLIRCDLSEIEYDKADATVEDAGDSTKQKFCIATWNIAHGRGSGDSNWKEGGNEKRKRVEKIAAEIVKFDADVVILNEVDFSATWSGGFDQAELIAKKAGYPICIKQANLDFGFIFGRWYFGNVILSRLPVTDQQVVELQPMADWEAQVVGHKRGLSCTIEISPQHSLSIVGLHLESRGEAIRVKQIDDVARHAGQLTGPIVIAGDLNTTPSNFPNSQTDFSGVNAFDKLIEQTQFSYSPDSVIGTQSLTYSTIEPKLLIDWILLSHELRLVKQEIIDSQLSDHRPVVATIEFVSED
ncbi:endonuclease/exonuclease/phosphatase family protein [bacterium]|nr:endonuclease/exonuclease/phosphatase family protein [bacterium]